MPKQAVCVHDSNWLSEAVFNILDNAVKYSEPGGTVEVSLKQNEMYMKLQVRDYGIGIDAGKKIRFSRDFTGAGG